MLSFCSILARASSVMHATMPFIILSQVYGIYWQSIYHMVYSAFSPYHSLGQSASINFGFFFFGWIQSPWSTSSGRLPRLMYQLFSLYTFHLFQWFWITFFTVQFYIRFISNLFASRNWTTKSTVVHENIWFFNRVFSGLTEENVKLFIKLFMTNEKQKVDLLQKGRDVYVETLLTTPLIFSSHN